MPNAAREWVASLRAGTATEKETKVNITVTSWFQRRLKYCTARSGMRGRGCLAQTHGHAPSPARCARDLSPRSGERKEINAA
jgi:hypothetical protein